MQYVAIHSTGQIFMVFYSTISQNTHKMGKISNIHTFEILGHPSGWVTFRTVAVAAKGCIWYNHFWSALAQPQLKLNSTRFELG